VARANYEKNAVLPYRVGDKMVKAGGRTPSGDSQSPCFVVDDERTKHKQTHKKGTKVDNLIKVLCFCRIVNSARAPDIAENFFLLHAAAAASNERQKENLENFHQTASRVFPSSTSPFSLCVCVCVCVCVWQKFCVFVFQLGVFLALLLTS